MNNELVQSIKKPKRAFAGRTGRKNRVEFTHYPTYWKRRNRTQRKFTKKTCSRIWCLTRWNSRLDYQEDKGFLAGLNLSALSFIVFPLLGILVPLIIWISKKDKIKNGNEIAKEVLNFEITWTMIVFIGYFSIVLGTFYTINANKDIDTGIIGLSIFSHMVFFGIMYIYNLILIIINSVRINNGRKT